jgi:hypothetical protein
MAHSEIVFKHPATDRFVTTPVGFSWTTFFFGFIPAMMRGDYKGAGIQFGTLAGLAILTKGLGVIVPALLFGFLYNRLYIRKLVSSGYLVSAWDSPKSIEDLGAELGVALPVLPEAEAVRLVAE